MFAHVVQTEVLVRSTQADYEDGTGRQIQDGLHLSECLLQTWVGTVGKASRKKKEARAAREDTAEKRFSEKRCMHCGSQKQTTALWCDPCSLTARRRAPFRAYPNFKGPDFTDEQVEIIKTLATDPRWAWGIPVDLAYYSDPTPTQDQPAESA